MLLEVINEKRYNIVSADNRGSLPTDSGRGEHGPTSSERWGEWEVGDEDTQPQRAIVVPSSPPAPMITQKEALRFPIEQEHPANAQFVHREHVSGALPVNPSEAPLFRPASFVPSPPQAPQAPQAPQQRPVYPPPQQWQGYPPQGMPPFQNQGYPVYYPNNTAYQGYPPGYPPYGVYPGYNGYPPYAWQPLRPKRDGYRLAVVIVSLVGSILALLAGLASVLILLLVMIGTAANPVSRAISGGSYFSGLLTFIAFIIAGIGGGGFSLYHSIRGILNKRSTSFRLPWFWIFLILYVLVLSIGYALLANGQEIAVPALSVVLIILAAIFPALTLLALAVRRLRYPQWITTMRRFTLALTSGATLGIALALGLELGLLFLVVRGAGATIALQCIDNPDRPGCGTFTTFDLIFLIVAIVGPIVEETVKPLAVALYIGRILSASETFLLGMACGIGFAVVETVGYIGSGYHDWLAVAIERTGAGLLHGVGAGMVALGWYYLVHAQKYGVRKALGCWSYAVLQHVIWNATAVLGLLPGPVGTSLNSWNLNLGFVALPFLEVLNIIEAILILVFFFYITGRLRRMAPATPPPKRDDRGASQQTLVVG
jgi:RsiW-degrading membrane proteinase PrsW (M82 family)